MKDNSDLVVRIDANLITLNGHFGELSQMPAWNNIHLDRKVILELQPLLSLNSIGTREMVSWSGAVPGSFVLPIEVHHAPSFFLDLTSKVSSLLPEHVVFKSFFLNYYCDENADEIKHLFVASEEGFFQVPLKVHVLKGDQDFAYSLDHVVERILSPIRKSCQLYDQETKPFFK